jgi:hypothetical protein
MMETTFAEILLVIVLGYGLYKLLTPVQRRLEYVLVKVLRRMMGDRDRPIIDISSRKERH